MRLGLSQAAYRWVSYPGLRIDLPQYGYRAMPYPYGTTTVGPEELDDNVDWWLARCKEWKLDSLYMAAIWFKDTARVREVGAKLASKGIEWIGSISCAWAVEPQEWPRELESAERQLKIFAAGGAHMSAIVNADPPGPPGQPVPNGGLRFGHFSREIPMARQIENMVRNLSEAVRLAKKYEIVFAFENHMDYRISEIVQVVKGVNSPWLRINYDFANSFAVVEDQVEAAHLAAPYTVMTHIKDMRVQSIATTGEPHFFHAPIGYGNVEIVEILEIFQRNTPNPDNISHCIETCCLPQYDPQLWMKLSIDWLEQHAAKYFPKRFPSASPDGRHKVNAIAGRSKRAARRA